MARHSHFHNIMLKKGAADKKRAKAFTKHARLIAVAAQQGGGDPIGNPLLRMAIENARADNTPRENIERAIKKGTGEDKEGVQISEAVYEAFGPGGTALMILVLTDNKNRALGGIKKVFQSYGGHLADSGAISWMFDHKGEMTIIGSGKKDEDELKIIDAGADDIQEGEEGEFLVYTKPQQLGEVRKNLEKAGYRVKSAELTYVPKNVVLIQEKEAAKQIMDLMEALDNEEDVTKVCANFDMSEEILGEL